MGQRRGLGVGGLAEPLYVVGLDADKRQVIVGPQEALLTKRVFLKEVNWIGAGDELPRQEAVRVKLRSTRPPAPATLYADRDSTYVELHSAEAGVAPGQACVFYAGESSRVLGGGWIERTEAAQPAKVSA